MSVCVCLRVCTCMMCAECGCLSRRGCPASVPIGPPSPQAATLRPRGSFYGNPGVSLPAFEPQTWALQAAWPLGIYLTSESPISSMLRIVSLT